MQLPLTAWQDAFAAALAADDPLSAAPPAIARLLVQPGFAVYRNTVMKGCIDALQANYPAVARLVGDPWFRAAAAVFARSHWPRQPALLLYGDDFAEFLERFEPAAELPYLPGVARLDRAWSEAHAAADEAPLEPEVIAGLSAGELARCVVRPHAAARWVWFEQPVYTIWARNRRDDADHEAPFDWHGEGALLTRPGGEVRHARLDAAGAAFLDACARGETLAEAAGAALERDARADLAVLMAGLLGAGAVGCCALRQPETHTISQERTQ